MTAIVIPVLDDIERTLRCLQSLSKAGSTSFVVIVVEHGVTHDSLELIRRHFPGTIVLTADSKLWWSGATNVGIRRAMELDAEFVLLLNNDTVVEPLFLDRLIQTARENPRHIVSSVVYFGDKPDIIRYAGGRIRWITGNIISTFYGETESSLPESPFEADWAGGMGVLVPIEVFRSVGIFDEEWFPHYAGDEDLWLRAKKSEFGLLVEPRSRIWVDDKHTGSKIRAARTPAEFIRVIFDRRFHANIPTTFKFYWRHCPFYALPSGLALHFIRNGIRMIKPS
jgi:GT2 family glycosyltransferase